MSPRITGLPTQHSSTDATANLAIRRADLQKKCELIEHTAIQASADLHKYIIESVCYELSVDYLITCEEMPIGKSAFYEVRRYFFYLLDKNKKM